MTTGLWMLLAIAPSFGASFYLETPPVSEKTAATEIAKAAEDAGPSRVVRRYLEGSGWQYVVVVEGFTDQGVAQKAAHDLARSAGMSVDVYAAEGSEARRVATETAGPAAIAKAEVVVPTPPPTPVPAPVPAPPAPSPRHGGPKTPAVVAASAAPPTPASADPSVALNESFARVRPAVEQVRAAPSLVFEFRRSVPDGPIVKHTYAARGADRYLDVVIESGAGTSSRSGISSGDAWLQASSVTHEDLTRTKEMLGRFAPDSILSTLFAVATTDAQLGGATFELDAKGNLARASWRDGTQDLAQDFGDWRDAGGGVVVPHRVRTWRDGALVDDVEILRLDVKPKVDERWFRVPS